MKVVDPHIHLWDTRRVRLPWLENPGITYSGDNRLLPQCHDVATFLRNTGEIEVERSVHVEANPAEPFEEATWLQSLADDPASGGHSHGIVAYADLSSEDAPALLECLSVVRNLRGIRQILNVHRDPRYDYVGRHFMQEPRWREHLKRLQRYGWSFDLQIYPSQASLAVEVLRDNPRHRLHRESRGHVRGSQPRGRLAAVARRLARRRLPKFLFEYIDGGAYAEVTARRNVADLERIELRQRVLRDVSNVEVSTQLFGQRVALPLALGPIGLAGMNARRGEVQAARAAEQAGVPFCLSTVSACSLAEVARGVDSPIWFQLYMIRDRGFLRELLAQARELQCSALVFTVDMPVPGTRYRDYRSGLAGAPGVIGTLRRAWQGALRPRWAWDVGACGRPHSLGNVAPMLGKKTGLEDFFAWMRNNFDSTVTWRDLEFIRAQWQGPLIVKGILDLEDAIAAHAAGADGIIVSNHGGRQLDGVPSTTHALPPIADKLGDSVTVLVDGGIRSGLDVIRMLALGARGVLLGRAWVYALAAAGQGGVAHLLKLIEAELRVAMALTGVTRIDAIDRSILVDNVGRAGSNNTGVLR